MLDFRCLRLSSFEPLYVLLTSWMYSNASYFIRSSCLLPSWENHISLKGLMSSEKNPFFTLVIMHFPATRRGFLNSLFFLRRRRIHINPSAYQNIQHAYSSGFWLHTRRPVLRRVLNACCGLDAPRTAKVETTSSHDGSYSIALWKNDLIFLMDVHQWLQMTWHHESSISLIVWNLSINHFEGRLCF